MIDERRRTTREISEALNAVMRELMAISVNEEKKRLYLHIGSTFHHSCSVNIYIGSKKRYLKRT
jgi:hypothetical protein